MLTRSVSCLVSWKKYVSLINGRAVGGVAVVDLVVLLLVLLWLLLLQSCPPARHDLFCENQFGGEKCLSAMS
jgi:hypothetical protein